MHPKGVDRACARTFVDGHQSIHPAHVGSHQPLRNSGVDIFGEEEDIGIRFPFPLFWQRAMGFDPYREMCINIL